MLQTSCAICLGLFLVLVLAFHASAERRTVDLPTLENNHVSPRVLYIENPRFPKVTQAELQTIVRTAADLVKEHFGVTMDVPSTINTKNIDEVFTDLATNVPDWMKKIIGDFRGGNVDWDKVTQMLIEQIEKNADSLNDQIAFAEPYLTVPPTANNVDGFAAAVTETYKARLAYWTKATLADGAPIIGKVAGRKDLPLNEYGYWTYMAKLGVKAEIVLTNQFIASVEYIPMPIHTAIRGGITGGSSEYNPASKLGASVWMSVAPFLMDDPQVNALRKGERYARNDALYYASIMLAHELGHLILHLGHPWSNEACVMRPAEVLDFATWAENLDAAKCRVGSGPEMTPGVLEIPIW